MWKTLTTVILSAFVVVFTSTAVAGSNDKDAIAMVDRAITYEKANGKDKLVAEVNAKNPEFVAGETYVVIASMDGVRLAHGANPKLVGKSLLEIQDVDGKFYGKDLVEVAKGAGKGWVDYKFKNPVSGKVEPKTSYVVRSGDHFLFVGIYKN
jgi:cytochrome c